MNDDDKVKSEPNATSAGGAHATSTVTSTPATLQSTTSTLQATTSTIVTSAAASNIMTPSTVSTTGTIPKTSMASREHAFIQARREQLQREMQTLEAYLAGADQNGQNAGNGQIDGNGQNAGNGQNDGNGQNAGIGNGAANMPNDGVFNLLHGLGNGFQNTLGAPRIQHISPLSLQAYAKQYLPAFRGKPEELRPFLQAVDTYQKDWGFDDQQTASFAGFAFPEDAESKKWLLWQKQRRPVRYRNLAFWAMEEGLRQALIDTYGATSNIGLLEKAMSASMYQQAGTTTNSYIVDLDQACYQFMEYILPPNLVSNEAVFSSVHTNAMMLFIRTGLHADIKRELNPILDTLKTPEEVAKEAQKTEMELGLAGQMKHGKQQQQQPKGNAASQPLGSQQNPITINAASAEKPKKPKYEGTCSYCGIKGHPADEETIGKYTYKGCYTKADDISNNIKRDRTDPFPKVQQWKKNKAKKNAEKVEQPGTVAGAFSTPSNMVATPPPSQPSMNAAAAISAGPARAVMANPQACPPGAVPWMNNAPYGNPTLLPDLRFDPYHLEAFQGPRQ